MMDRMGACEWSDRCVAKMLNMSRSVFCDRMFVDMNAAPRCTQR